MFPRLPGEKVWWGDKSPMSEFMKISIVIPVYNEQDSLRELHGEICGVAQSSAYDCEMIFVDDGSTDRSWEAISQIAADDARVHGIRFRRNFGKSAALAAGVRAANHDWIVMLDADLQDDISELPKLINQANAGFDLVNGWKADRQDPLSKRWPSKVFNWLVNLVSGTRLHDHNCGFKLLRREIFEEIQLVGDWHRFIPVLADSRGWRIAEVAVNHRRRKFGKSKYGLSRFLKASLDLITIGFLSNFHHRPQYVLGTVGLFSSITGAAGMVYLALYWLVRMTAYPAWPPVHERPLLLYSLGSLLVGVHLLALGFLAELIVANRGNQRTLYSIAETTRHENANEPVRESSVRVDGPSLTRNKQRT